MDITCISDLHGDYPQLQGGDLLILAGDYTATDKIYEWATFFKWLKAQKYQKKIMIAGNHDNFLTQGFPKNQKEADELKEIHSFLKKNGEDVEEDFEYLCDSGTTFSYYPPLGSFEDGQIFERIDLKIWGSPWTKTFPGINPKCTAFTVETDYELYEKWRLIPSDTDILITHSPPFGMLDRIRSGEHVGSLSLRNKVVSNDYMPNLKYHIFGHIHEQNGKTIDTCLTKFINASVVDENYIKRNDGVRIEIKKHKEKNE